MYNKNDHSNDVVSRREETLNEEEDESLSILARSSSNPGACVQPTNGTNDESTQNFV